MAKKLEFKGILCGEHSNLTTGRNMKPICSLFSSFVRKTACNQLNEFSRAYVPRPAPI